MDVVRRAFDELLHAAGEERGAVPEAGGPLEREDGHRHRPATVHLAEDAVRGDGDVVEDHLANSGAPFMMSKGRTVIPGLSMSTKNAVMPRCAEPGGPVRVRRTHRV